MSYDIGYYTPETWDSETNREYIKVTPFRAEGGTVRAEIVDDKLVPSTISECDINITWNYSKFYYEHIDSELGIRWLYGKTGAEVKDRLEKAIQALGIERYTGPNWIISAKYTLGRIFDDNIHLPIPEEKHKEYLKVRDWDSHPEFDYLVNIGYLKDGGAYWKATPGNAGYALMKILTWIIQNPDGVFNGD